MNLNKQTKKQSGFTIIEVMIVLAVAGLIMAIVFLAIPALQRSNRNTQRKNDASRLAGLVAEFQANNNGALPADVATGTVGAYTLSSGSTVSTKTAGTVPTAPTSEEIFYVQKLKCSDAKTAATTTSARSFVIWYGIEGGTVTQCVES